MRTITCIACGAKAQRAKSNFVFCLPCGHQHDRDAIKAACAVRKHIRSGAIKRAAEHICTDCGKQATEYDHRDYLKPVDVQPVCRSCNHLRGPAFNSVYRPPLMRQAGLTT